MTTQHGNVLMATIFRFPEPTRSIRNSRTGGGVVELGANMLLVYHQDGSLASQPSWVRYLLEDLASHIPRQMRALYTPK